MHIVCESCRHVTRHIWDTYITIREQVKTKTVESYKAQMFSRIRSIKKESERVAWLIFVENEVCRWGFLLLKAPLSCNVKLRDRWRTKAGVGRWTQKCQKNNYMSSFSMCFRQQRDYASHAHTFIINFKFILEELWY